MGEKRAVESTEYAGWDGDLVVAADGVWVVCTGSDGYFFDSSIIIRDMVPQKHSDCCA